MVDREDKILANGESGAEQKGLKEASSTTPQVSGRRTRAFRQEILTRLPVLSVPKWEAKETLNVYEELQVIVDLDADAFLEPLQRIGEKNHE